MRELAIHGALNLMHSLWRLSWKNIDNPPDKINSIKNSIQFYKIKKLRDKFKF